MYAKYDMGLSAITIYAILFACITSRLNSGKLCASAVQSYEQPNNHQVIVLLIENNATVLTTYYYPELSK